MLHVRHVHGSVAVFAQDYNEVLPGVASAVFGLIAVSWNLFRPQAVQEPLFRCELASVSCCGGTNTLSTLHVICFLGGLLVGILVLISWQRFRSTRTLRHNFQRLPTALRGAIAVC